MQNCKSNFHFVEPATNNPLQHGQGNIRRPSLQRGIETHKYAFSGFPPLAGVLSTSIHSPTNVSSLFSNPVTMLLRLTRFRSNTVPIWAHNQWPPSQNSPADFWGYQRQLQAAMGGGSNSGGVTITVDANVELPKSEPFHMLGSKLDGLTVSASDSSSSHSEPKGKEKENAPPPPPDSTQKTPKRRNAAFDLPHRLEAYILRVQVGTFIDTMTWHLETELLHLDESAIEAHMNTLSSDYSIINAIGELRPDEYRLVQTRTKARLGHLLCVQQGAQTDIATQMGTLQIKPVLFVIRTAAFPEPIWEQEKAKQSGLGGFGVNFPPFVPPQPAPTTLTQSEQFQTNGPVQADRFSDPIGPNNTNTLFTNLFAPKEPPKQALSFDSPDLWRPPLPARAEDYYHVEKDGSGSSTAKWQHFMTITMGDVNAKSLEELRVDDYKAGRKGPTISDLSNPWGNRPNHDKADEMPFGGQYVNLSGLLAALNLKPPGRLIGGGFGGANTQNNTGPGLFGQPAPPSQGLFGTQNNTTQGLFGQPAPPSQGLFGQNAPSGHGLFGTQNNTGPGLFGQPAPANQGLFGTQNNTTPGLFGQPAPASQGLFGQPVPPNQGLFGTKPAAPPGGGLFASFKSASSTDPLGAPASTPSGGLFGAVQHDQPDQSSNSSKFPGRPVSSTCNPPQNTNNVSSTSIFGAGYSSSYGGIGLFGATVNPPPSTSLFGTIPSNGSNMQPASTTASSAPRSTSLFGQAGASSTSTLPTTATTATSATQGGTTWACTKCSTSLVFHPAAEQFSGLCDSCKGNKQTTCWLCERKMSEKTPDAPTKSAEKAPIGQGSSQTAAPTATKETGQSNTTGPVKNTMPEVAPKVSSPVYVQPAFGSAPYPPGSSIFPGIGAATTTAATPTSPPPAAGGTPTPRSNNAAAHPSRFSFGGSPAVETARDEHKGEVDGEGSAKEKKNE